MYRCLIFFISILLVGCASDPKPQTAGTPASSPDSIKWQWQPKAIKMSVSATDKLNWYDGQAHSLMVCVYQLSDKAKFVEYASTANGINIMLACNRFDNTVTQSERIFLQPGSKWIGSFDRFDKTKFFAVVAGYVNKGPSVTAIYDVPVQKSETGMWWWSKDWYTPEVLSVSLTFNEDTLRQNDEVKKNSK